MPKKITFVCRNNKRHVKAFEVGKHYQCMDEFYRVKCRKGNAITFEKYGEKQTICREVFYHPTLNEEEDTEVARINHYQELLVATYVTDIARPQPISPTTYSRMFKLKNYVRNCEKWKERYTSNMPQLQKEYEKTAETVMNKMNCILDEMEVEKASFENKEFEFTTTEQDSYMDQLVTNGWYFFRDRVIPVMADLDTLRRALLVVLNLK